MTLNRHPCAAETTAAMRQRTTRLFLLLLCSSSIQSESLFGFRFKARRNLDYLQVLHRRKLQLIDSYIPFPDDSTSLADLHYFPAPLRYRGGSSTFFRKKNEWDQLRNMWESTAPEMTIAAVCGFLCFLSQFPSLKGVMRRHFLWSISNFQRKRFHTLLSATLMHEDPLHLLFNMASLFALSPTTRRFLKHHYSLVLLGSSFCSHLTFTLFHPQGSCLGLSGFIFTLLAVYAQRNPDTVLTIHVGGLFPLRSTARNLLYISLVISMLMSFVPHQRIAHSAHLGGLLFGVIYYRLPVPVLSKVSAIW